MLSNLTRGMVLQWVHSSHLSCHPGVARTLEVLRGKFWWPTMDSDTWEFVGACPTCAQNMTPHQSSSGLLQPLLIPARPWSHIALDSITGLPPSQRHTVISTIVDRFSKAAHFCCLNYPHQSILRSIRRHCQFNFSTLNQMVKLKELSNLLRLFLDVFALRIPAP